MRNARRLITRMTLTAALAGATTAPALAAPAALTLADARQRTLAANPRLAVATAEAAAAEAGVTTARAWPNPELQLELENLGGGDSLEPLRERTVALSQRFEVGGKRRARVAAARAGTAVARLDLKRQRRDLLAEVERSFVAVLGAQRRLDLAEQALATARQVVATVGELVRAGETSPIEEVRARGEEGLALADVEAARLELDLARSRLARLWGAEEADFALAAGELGGGPLPEQERLLSSLPELPDLARWQVEVDRAAALRDAARAQALPDPTLTAGIRDVEGVGERVWVATLSLPLPLFDRARGQRAEAQSLLEATERLRRAEEAELRSAVRVAWRTLEVAEAEARTIQNDVLPHAEEAFRAVEEGYRRGKFPLLDLLAARRGLYEAQGRLIDAEVRLSTARADLGRYVVVPEDSLSGGGR